jgi:cobalt/nickel transport system permease protein
LTVALVVLVSLTLRLRPSLRGVVRRVVVVWLLAGLVTLGWIGRPDWLPRAGLLMVKSTFSLWAVNLLVQATPLPALVAGLRWLGVPAVWTETFAFWGRYSSVLAEEWRRLQLARRARTFERSRWLRFKALAAGLGILFIRAYERAEQVHCAMLARGYRGVSQ